MALTKIGKEGITGISNASNATAITITSDENVGIGTGSPGGKLTIEGTQNSLDSQLKITASGQVSQYMGGSSAVGLAIGHDHASLPIVFKTGVTSGTGVTGSGTERMRIDSSGNVGIGTTAPDAMLHLSGGNEEAKIKFQVGTANADKFKIYASTAGRLYVNSDNGNTGVYLTHNGTSWTGNSDETLKDNITSLGTVGDKLKNYRTSYFTWKADTETPPKRNIGFIAQDWETDFPEVVTKKEGETLGMQYTETIPILLKYIQELEARITSLEAG